jgi:hypothetical protein
MVIRPGFAALLATLLCAAKPALGYRPFDSTDADVADAGAREIELSPLSYRHNDDGAAWIAPALIANYGITDGLEAVVEGEGAHFSRGGSEVTDIAASLKTILREGSLQGASGWSMAAELSALLPGVRADDGAGFELTGIASQAYGWGTVHFNLGAGQARGGNAAGFFGAILEGRGSWPVRPVAEVRYDREFGVDEEVSALVGAIWPVNEKLSFDLAFRHAWIDNRPDEQVRAGLTFDLQ